MRKILKFFLLFSPFVHLPAQEGTWTIGSSAGVVFLNMKAVDQDNQNDVEGWNLYENIPIGSFERFDRALGLALSGSYRFDRDFAVTFGLANFKKEIATSYHDNEVSLQLRRSVGSTDVKAGLAYFFPPAIHTVETYFLVEIGRMASRATAEAFGNRIKKLNDSTITYTTYDTYGRYDKSKLIVNVCLGATSEMFEPFFMRAEAAYRFAKMGKIDGVVTRQGAAAPHTTSIEFDYSSFSVTFGLGVAF